MADFSFDIVSQFDRQELKNAVDQATREITTRYDLKDTRTTIDLEKEMIVINTASDLTLGSVKDVLESKVLRRNLSLKILDYQNHEEASGGRVRQVIKLKQGLNEDLAKQIAKSIRTDFKKVTPQIQGDLVRVSAKNKDDLQTVIQNFRKTEGDYPVPLQFINYR
jgi:cyclic-di-GMP-binding protein